MDKILRHETLFGKIVELKDASHLIKEKTVGSEIKIFKISKILSEDNLFLGFGKPNVFLGYSEGGSIYKFDAKSLKRQKSNVVDTKGWAQSGLIINIKDPSKEMKHRIKVSTESFIGSSYSTCVNANARVLNRAGFTSKGKDLSEFYFPIPLAKQIIRNGLEFEGQPVSFEIIKTVPNYLESFGLSVIKSQWFTLNRHFKRAYKIKAKKYKILDRINKIKRFSVASVFGVKKEKIIEESVTLYPENKSYRSDLEITVTTPSKLGLGLLFICGPHVFYEIKHSNEKIEKLLPKKLKEYSAKKGSFFNFIKKEVLFSKLVISFLRKHLAKTKESFVNATEKDVFNMIRTDTDNIPNKYNLIVTSESIYVIKIGIKYKIVDWVLSKHVLLSGYSNDVRYAGEFWKESDGIIYFNNNSGTYAPSSDSVSNALILLEQVFPNTIIKTKYIEK